MNSSRTYSFDYGRSQTEQADALEDPKQEAVHREGESGGDHTWESKQAGANRDTRHM